MPNDAKLGLVVGLSVVVAIGMVFFRAETTSGSPAASVPSVHSPLSLPAQRAESLDPLPH